MVANILGDLCFLGLGKVAFLQVCQPLEDLDFWQKTLSFDSGNMGILLAEDFMPKQLNFEGEMITIKRSVVDLEGEEFKS